MARDRNTLTFFLFQKRMSSFLENIRLNDELREKLYSASDKVVNYVNERPLWARFRNLSFILDGPIMTVEINMND